MLALQNNMDQRTNTVEDDALEALGALASMAR